MQTTRPPNPCRGEREYGRESVVETNAAGQKSTTYNPPQRRKGDTGREATISFLMTVSDKLLPGEEHGLGSGPTQLGKVIKIEI